MGGTPNGSGVGSNNGPAPTRQWAAAGRPFLYLFIAALTADLVLAALQAPALRLFSKPLLVPGLMLYYRARAVHTGAAPQRWIVTALLFSWTGDVLLLFEDRTPLFFILGLAAFLVAHIFYCLFFLGLWRKERLRLHFPFLMGVAVYYTGLVVLLWPGLGGLKVPVLLYGAVICTMLLLALHTVLLPRSSAARLLMPGAVLFVLSDSVLAVNRFLQPFPFAGVMVMLTYGLAQWLLVEGALAYTAIKPMAHHAGSTPKLH